MELLERDGGVVPPQIGKRCFDLRLPRPHQPRRESRATTGSRVRIEGRALERFKVGLQHRKTQLRAATVILSPLKHNDRADRGHPEPGNHNRHQHRLLHSRPHFLPGPMHERLVLEPDL